LTFVPTSPLKKTTCCVRIPAPWRTTKVTELFGDSLMPD
jgi:hypothetical protein